MKQKTDEYEKKLVYFLSLNNYKTKATKSALVRFVNWLDKESIKEQKMTFEEKLLLAISGKPSDRETKQKVSV